MSLEYAEAKIMEALRLAKGNAAAARQYVAAWAGQDVKLLQALTKHHMNGIVAYHVDRVVSGRANKPKPANQAARKPVSPKAKPVLAEHDPFGKEIVRAVSEQGGQVFGFDNGEPTGPRRKASQNHINAIRQIADRSRSKLN